MSDEINVDINELKVREIEEIEELLGESIQDAFKGKSLGRAMRALGYVTAKRENPDFTWEDAGDLVVRFSDDVPPTDASV